MVPPSALPHLHARSPLAPGSVRDRRPGARTASWLVSSLVALPAAAGCVATEGVARTPAAPLPVDVRAPEGAPQAVGIGGELLRTSPGGTAFVEGVAPEGSTRLVVLAPAGTRVLQTRRLPSPDGGDDGFRVVLRAVEELESVCVLARTPAGLLALAGPDGRSCQSEEGPV